MHISILPDKPSRRIRWGDRAKLWRNVNFELLESLRVLAWACERLCFVFAGWLRALYLLLQSFEYGRSRKFAFERCFDLESVAWLDFVAEIRAGAFEDCWKLTNIYIPQSAIVIGECAFAKGKCLSEIKIPLSVGSFGDFAFERCDSLRNVFIDEGVASIGSGAFRGAFFV